MSLTKTPAVNEVVSFKSVLIRNSCDVTSRLVVESTNRLGAPHVPVGTLPGAYVVYVT